MNLFSFISLASGSMAKIKIYGLSGPVTLGVGDEC